MVSEPDGPIAEIYRKIARRCAVKIAERDPRLDKAVASYRKYAQEQADEQAALDHERAFANLAPLT